MYLMWKDPKYRFVKYGRGSAFYYTLAKNYVPFSGDVQVVHLLSGQSYPARYCDLVTLDWDDIPASYRMDACAINQFIRDNCDDYPEIKGPRRTKGFNMKYTFLKCKHEDHYWYCLTRDWEAVVKGSGYCQVRHIATGEPDDDGIYSDEDATVIGWEEIPSNIRMRAASQNPDYSELLPREDQPKAKNKKDGMKSNFLSTLGLEFGKYEGDDLALSMAGVAARKKDGGFVVYDTTNKQLIDVGDLKMDVPFFMMPTAYDAIQEGDLLKIDGTFLIVAAKTADGGLRCISPTTGSTVNKVARTNLWGFYFYTKIISLFNFGQQGGNPMQGMMANPMMMLLMSKDNEGGNMDNMMEMMLMGQIMGSGNNPFGNMFGGQPAQPTVQARTSAPRATGTKRATKKK